MGTRICRVCLVAPADVVPMRIDAWVAASEPSFPRSAASDPRTEFRMDGVVVKKSKRVSSGSRVEVDWYEDVFNSAVAQEIPLRILYEDDDMLVIDKPQSLVVHPGAGNREGTLVNALLYRYGDDFMRFADDDDEDADGEYGPSAPDSLRPGIVHRLDKETSGVMVVAKTRAANVGITSQFTARTVVKYYIAIVKGTLPNRYGELKAPIVRDRRDRRKFAVGGPGEGKEAWTDYRVLRQFAGYALVRLRLHTGRTHQIRVHMLHAGCPILGDPLYARSDGNFPDSTMMLHALTLELDHPADGRRMRFTAPMPQRFKDVLLRLKKG